MFLITSTPKNTLLKYKVDVSHLMNENLYFNGKWLDVDLSTNTRNACLVKRFGLNAQKKFTFLDTRVNISAGTYIIIC